MKKPMIRLFGFTKVMLVLMLNFLILFEIFRNVFIVVVVFGFIVLYVWLGGYISLAKEGATRCSQLPLYASTRLHTAKTKLIEDVKENSSIDISKVKIYLITGDEEINATAYGGNCISLTKGTFNNADSITLNAVLAHEISHILNYDPEFNRAVFCFVTIVVATISVVSAGIMFALFLLFFIFNCFKSWLGVLTFKGVTRGVRGIFSFIQKGIATMYYFLMSFVSRHAEYRSDLYSCSLGYGVQLVHFLKLVDPKLYRQFTLTEILYRSHPRTEKRIARLEKYITYGS